MIEFIDKTEEENGTFLNRDTMMAIQGFVAQTTRKNNDGSITETNKYGNTLTTRFLDDGSIEEKFVGRFTLTKTTKFNSDGSYTEVVQ